MGRKYPGAGAEAGVVGWGPDSTCEGWTCRRESEITCKLAFQDENETETRLGCFCATTAHVTWGLALPLLGEDDTVRYILI